jgi:hypothetical protein
LSSYSSSNFYQSKRIQILLYRRDKPNRQL